MKFNNETLRAAVKEWLDDESKAEKKYGHISDWDTSEVTDMKSMFSQAYHFNQPLEKWDVSNVTNMSSMFYMATSFNQPLEKWDVSQVTHMSKMFAGAISFAHHVPKKNSENSSTRKMEVYIENLDKKTTLERFAKDWLYSEQEVQEIREELEDSGYWDDGRCEMEMKDDHIEVSIWPDEVETYGYVTELYPDEFLLLHYHIEQRDEGEYTVLSIQNQSELLSNIVFKGGESDKKSRLNEDELAVFNQSEDTDCGDNGKYNYQLFIKKEDFFKTGWNGVIKTIGLDIE